MNRFFTREVSNVRLEFHDRDSNYVLIYFFDPQTGYGKRNLSFKTGLLSNKRGVIVTGRDLVGEPKKSYHQELEDIADFADLQVVEMGPGLGEFIPLLTEVAKIKPIAIDPVNYNNLLELMEYARSRVPEIIVGELDIFKQRAEIYLDSTKVWLVNTTLEEAVKDKRLFEIADVFVDNFASFYDTMSRGLQTQADMIKLIKEGGRCYCDYSPEVFRRTDGRMGIVDMQRVLDALVEKREDSS
jgi:hypothetical protein